MRVRSASVCTGIDNVRDTLDMLERKIDELGTYHDELASRPLHDNSFLLVDPLYFQHRVLEMELSFWREVASRFTNRVYADLYKLLMFLRRESHDILDSATLLSYSEVSHRVYKDLDFSMFTTPEITAVSDELHKIIELWKADLTNHDAYVQRLRSQTDRGVNIQNLLNSEVHKTAVLRDKLRYIKECIDSYTRYHEQFLTSFKVKLVVMHSEMTASLDLESSNVLETLKVDREEEEQLKQAVQQSTTRDNARVFKRRWTIVGQPDEVPMPAAMSDSEEEADDAPAPPITAPPRGIPDRHATLAGRVALVALRGALVVSTIGLLIASAAGTVDAIGPMEDHLSMESFFSLVIQQQK